MNWVSEMKFACPLLHQNPSIREWHSSPYMMVTIAARFTRCFQGVEGTVCFKIETFSKFVQNWLAAHYVQSALS